MSRRMFGKSMVMGVLLRDGSVGNANQHKTVFRFISDA
jgi:hypothetical protein